MCKKLVKNSQPFEENFRKPQGRDFFDSHCRALESVSIASALSSALTIYPYQIRVHQTQTVSTSYSSEGVVAGYSGKFTPGGYPSTVTHTT